MYVDVPQDWIKKLNLAELKLGLMKALMSAHSLLLGGSFPGDSLRVA